jgi:hypothetical protein
MLSWSRLPKHQSIAQYLSIFIFLILSLHGSAQGAEKYSLPYYIEQRAYPLLPGKKSDPATITSVSGRINKLFYVEYYYSDASFRILGLELKTDQNRTYQIHLAPLTWLEYKNVPIYQGARLRVEGSIISLERESVLIATSLCWEDNRVNLRHRDGRWLWTLP